MGKYEEARRRSRDVMVVEYKKERCKIDVNKLKKLFIAAGLTLVIASSALTAFITHSVDSIKDKITINEYLSQYSTILSDNTHRTQDNEHFYYDHYEIGKEISDDAETFDEELYAVYTNMSYRDSNIDQIVRATGEYSSLDEYLVANKFVDENGNPSEEKYKAVMDTQILAKAALKALDCSEEVKDAIKR